MGSAGSHRTIDATAPGTHDERKEMLGVEEIKEAVLGLTPEHQAEIADAILANIADPGPLSGAWKAEIDRREAEYERGEVELVDNTEALARIRGERQ